MPVVVSVLSALHSNWMASPNYHIMGIHRPTTVWYSQELENEKAVWLDSIIRHSRFIALITTLFSLEAHFKLDPDGQHRPATFQIPLVPTGSER